MRRGSWWIAALLVIASGGAARAEPRDGERRERSAKAAELDEDALKPIRVALVAGYGEMFDPPGELNPLGVGFGVSGGYHLASFYLGARFMFFLGESERVSGAQISANALTIGLEAGYELTLIDALLRVRPEVGVGLIVTSAEAMTATSTSMSRDESSEDLYIAPGLAVLFDVSERVFVGIDAQLPIVLDGAGTIAQTTLATAGMRF